MKKKRTGLTVFLTLVAFICCLIIVIPLLIVIFGSFKDPAGAQQFNLALPSQWHFENYLTVIQKGNMGRAFINSMIITVSVTLIVLVAGSLNAFVVSRRKSRYTSFVYYLFLLGMITPIQIVTTFVLLQQLNLTGTFVGVICVETAIQLPWTIFTLTGFIKSVPRDMDEAAFIDGASPLRMFFSIIFPLLRPIIATVVVTTAMGAWNEFMVPLYFFSSSSKWTMPLTVYNFFGQYSSSWNLVFADLILTALPISVLYLFCQKYVVAGTTAGAVKG